MMIFHQLTTAVGRQLVSLFSSSSYSHSSVHIILTRSPVAYSRRYWLLCSLETTVSKYKRPRRSSTPPAPLEAGQ